MTQCGNCGHELEMRSFRALDNTCPHCGELRYSKTTRTRAMKLRLFLYGLAGCVALDVFLGVPKIVSIPFLLCPLIAVIWRYYRPFKEHDPKDERGAINNPNA